jgi:hypothetical protein
MDSAIIVENNYKIYVIVLNEFESVFNEKARYVFQIKPVRILTHGSDLAYDTSPLLRMC